MRYNPKAKLDESQIEHRNPRPGGHNAYARFEGMEDAKKGLNRTQQKAAVVRRLKKRAVLKNGPFKKSDGYYY